MGGGLLEGEGVAHDWPSRAKAGRRVWRDSGEWGAAEAPQASELLGRDVGEKGLGWGERDVQAKRLVSGRSRIVTLPRLALSSVHLEQ